MTFIDEAKRFLGALKEARITTGRAHRLADEMYMRWGGSEGEGANTGESEPAPRRRGRPPRQSTQAASAGSPGPDVSSRSRSRRISRCVEVLRERGPMTREEIIAATGWNQRTANSQLPQLIKSGAIFHGTDNRYGVAEPASTGAAATTRQRSAA